MSETHRPKQVADQLQISPATLRLWSTKFSEVLSPSAQSATTEKGTSAQRRYTEEDVRYFHRAKQLLGEGKTYEEVLAILQEEGLPEADVITESIEQHTEAPTSALAVTDSMQIALISLREALASKDETIEALRETVNATMGHVTDLQQENQRLRQELETLQESARTPVNNVSWWKRLLGQTE